MFYDTSLHVQYILAVVYLLDSRSRSRSISKYLDSRFLKQLNVWSRSRSRF